MSRIQTIEPNYHQRKQSNNVIPTMPRKNYSNPNFAGTETAVKDFKAIKKDILSDVEKELNKKLGNGGKFFKWLNDGKCELQGQLITAVFTTTLAPLMIVCNPFTKNKTKEDKQYLAWRQPISAAVTLGCSVPMTVAFDKQLNKIYNEGYVKSIDLRLEPSKEYLKKSFNTNFENAKKNNKLQEFLEKYDADVDSTVKENGFNGGKVKSAYKKGCLNGFTKKVGEQRKELFATIISEKPENIKTDGANIVVDKKDLQKDHLVKVARFDASEVEKYINANSLHKRTFGDFMKDKFKVEFHEEGELKGKLKSEIIDKKLSEIKALDFLEEFGLIKEKSITESDLKEILLKHRQSLPGNKDNLAKPLHGSAADAEELFNVIGKDTSRNIQMTVGEQIGKAKSITLGQLFHQVDFRTKNGKLQNLMDMKMSDSLMKFKDIFKGKIKDIDDKTALKDFAKNIISKSAKKMGTDARNHKYYVLIAFNVILTAVSCTVLNWAYPRIVEAIAPNLIKNRTKTDPAKQSEAEKGGNK